MPIFYYPKISKNSTKLEISGEEYNHIKNSFRKKENEKISITNGAGLLAIGYIEKITSNKIIINISEIVEHKKSKPHIALAFSILKKNNKFVIEKCTELGIYEFFPFISQKTIKKNYSQKLIEKFQKVAISAMKQSDSFHLPKINTTTNFNELITSLQERYLFILAWEEEKNQLLHQTLINVQKDICLIVGPEGGFEFDEVEFAKNHSAKTISLGNHILRGETAAIAMTANTFFHFMQNDKSFY